MSTHGILGFSRPDVPQQVADSFFSQMDKDSNKVIDKNELEVLVDHYLGLDSDRAQAALMLIDKDGSGDADIVEFTAWLRSKVGISIITDDTKFQLLCEALDMFRSYDADNSNTLSKSELNTILVAMNAIGGEVSIDSAFEGLDTDKNGIISFSEFLKWLNWLPSPPASPKR